jgi:hypothetical protein
VFMAVLLSSTAVIVTAPLFETPVSI